MRFEQVKNDLKAAMSAQAPKTSGYDTRAEVVRVEGDKAWVHIPGGVDETPVALTIDAKEGDQVQVRVAGGSAWLVGNASAPPTDDRTAIAARLQADAAKLAADAAQEDIDAQQEHFWHDEFGAHVLSGTNATRTRYRTDIKGAGQTISAIDPDGVETVVAEFGADGIQIGEEEKSHLEMDYNSLQLKDKEGGAYFFVSDLRDYDGYLTKTFIGDGSTVTFSLGYPNALHVISVSVDGNPVTFSEGINNFTLSTAPANGAVIAAKYDPSQARVAKAFTFGSRLSGSNIGASSVAEGEYVEASGEFSHASGFHSIASGSHATAEGLLTEASGEASHAEGRGYSASMPTLASGAAAHAEGNASQALGDASHAEGRETTASGDYSHAQNIGTVAATAGQTAIGKYNDNQSTNAFEIGNGTAENSRSNAFAVDWDGKIQAGATNALLFDAIGTSIPSGANLNNYDVGYYVAASNTIAASLSNCPTSVAFIMIVLQRAAGRPIQIILDNNAGLHVRAKQSDSAWSNWSTK